ncbi:MAG: hypothetical protein HOV94_27595, partial [Saccharothrix sp.]|nr:hypothetical protein [Saccharothrix sp.]
MTQLNTGALGTWCVERFTGTQRLVDAVGTAVRGLEPARPPGRPELAYYAAVGGMWGQRLAWLVEPAPPVAA